MLSRRDFLIGASAAAVTAGAGLSAPTRAAVTGLDLALPGGDITAIGIGLKRQGGWMLITQDISYDLFTADYDLFMLFADEQMDEFRKCTRVVRQGQVTRFEDVRFIE